jgi:hypothetical protein
MQYKVRDPGIKKDDLVWIQYLDGNTVRHSVSYKKDLKRARMNEDPKWKYSIAAEDLAPGDIVEIQGDYAVKVGGTKGNFIPTHQAGSILITTTGYDSTSVMPETQKQECRCPFGPNLGPIEHVTSCKEKK